MAPLKKRDFVSHSTAYATFGFYLIHPISISTWFSGSIYWLPAIKNHSVTNPAVALMPRLLSSLFIPSAPLIWVCCYRYWLAFLGIPHGGLPVESLYCKLSLTHVSIRQREGRKLSQRELIGQKVKLLTKTLGNLPISSEGNLRTLQQLQVKL